MRSSTLLSHFSTWLICPEPASQNHFSRFSDWIRKVQKPVNLVDLVKSFQTNILLAKFGFDTAENEPLKVCQKFKISQKLETEFEKTEVQLLRPRD